MPRPQQTERLTLDQAPPMLARLAGGLEEAGHSRLTACAMALTTLDGWAVTGRSLGGRPLSEATIARARLEGDSWRDYLNCGISARLLVEAAGSMAKASTHEPVGHTGKGLWGHKDLQLPAYIQHVANDLIESGHPESEAVHMAVGIVKNWAEGHDGHGNKVSDTTKAAAVKAVGEWEKLKATHGK